MTLELFFLNTHPVEQQHRKELFLKNKLAIAEDARFESEFGRYPVLYIDFSVSKYIGCTINNANGRCEERVRFNYGRISASIQKLAT